MNLAFFITLAMLSAIGEIFFYNFRVELISKMSRIKLGSRVSTEAWRFDQKNVNKLEDRWSYLHFKSLWRDARLFGTVKGKSGNRWLVQWDIDQQIASWETDYLFKEVDDTPLQGKILIFLFHSFT